MKLQKKNKKKEKAIAAIPKVEAAVVQQEAIPAVVNTNPGPQPCVIFRDDVDIHIPTLKEHGDFVKAMAAPQMAVATGYQEDGSINISVVDQATFPDFMAGYLTRCGCAERADLIKEADPSIAGAVITNTRAAIFAAIASKINSVVSVAMSQAKKVIVDELAKHSTDLYKQVVETINTTNDLKFKYGMPEPIYPGDISTSTDGSTHSIGNVVANIECTEANYRVVMEFVATQIDRYIIKEYDGIMSIIMAKVYSTPSIDIVEADKIYAIIEEYAADVFKCYAIPIHNSLDDFVKDILFAQICAFPTAKVRNYFDF